MSSGIGGKFQDHYAILGIESNADTDRLVAAYARASEKYHPKNPDTGDEDKYAAVGLAFEVLSDTVLRREFDKVKGIDQDDGNPKFSGLAFFEALGRETRLRVAMLCVLYDRRRTKPFRPSLSMRQLENSLHATEEELNFALWYLKQRSFVGQDDKSSLLINVEGMDYLESDPPAPEVVMPFIKAGALVAVADAAPDLMKLQDSVAASGVLASTPVALAPEAALPVVGPADSAPTPKPHESVRNIMRRAIARV